MLDLMKTIGATVSAFFKTRLALQVENASLRHQLIILRRTSPKRLRLTRLDRMIFASLHRLWPKVLGSIAIVQPKTVMRWHRQGFRLYWRWMCGGKGGRPKVPKELRGLIREMSLANPLWGAPRVHGELLKLGFEVSETTVATYMVKPPRPPGQTWTTFLRNHAHQMASTDFFVVPTLTFQLLYVMVVLDHARRSILHIAVTTNPTAEWTAQQLREAFPWNTAPRFLVHDGHGSFKGECAARARTMGIQMIRIAPASPWQNAYVERVIGSIRRECTDHLVALNARHLTAILRSYSAYYNRSRTHLSLGKDTPMPQPANTNTSGRVVAIPEVGGLHHSYKRLAA
jgi:transposase InsO family protein